jgi:hypothetical protein
VNQICYVFATLALCASALPANSHDLAGTVDTTTVLCVDAKSAAVIGETVDTEPDMTAEVLGDLVQHHRCVFLDVFRPSVTFKRKVDHVAKTDVWLVDWEGQEWFVPADSDASTGEL